MRKSAVVLLLVAAMLANGVAHRFAGAAMLPSMTAAAVGDRGADSAPARLQRQAGVAWKSANMAAHAPSRCRPYTAGPASPRSACMSDLSLPAGESAAISGQIPARLAVAHSRMPPGRGSPHPFHPPRVSS